MTSPQQPYGSASAAPNNAAPSGWYTDPATGAVRWWNGSGWGPFQQAHHPNATATNGFATAALILGIFGFATTWIPLFIGLVVGGIPDILAIVFGAVAIARANRRHGKGLAPAIVGLILGSLAFLSILVGAGTIW